MEESSRYSTELWETEQSILQFAGGTALGIVGEFSTSLSVIPASILCMGGLLISLHAGYRWLRGAET